MDTKQLTDIIGIATGTVGFLVGLLGLLGAAFTLIQNLADRSDKAILPFDSSSMKFIEIKRCPLDRKDWKANQNSISSYLLKVINFLGSTTLLGLITGILTNLSTTASISPLDTPLGLFVNYILGHSILALIIATLFISSYIFLFFNARSTASRKGKTPEDARFFLFQYASITIEAEYLYLFSRCLEILKSMQAEAIELDTDMHLLEASLRKRINTVAGKIMINIQPIQTQGNRYAVKVSFTPFSSQSVINKCKTINYFVNQIIGKAEIKVK